MVKQPKLYFFDTGLAAYLLELTGPKQVRESSYQGALFENMMIADRLKQLYHQGDKPNLYFFRDSNGVEVDLLETQNEVVSLTEIKSGTTYLPAMANNLNKIAALFHPNSCQKTMVYTGGESFRVKDLAVQSWSLIK